MTTDPGNYRPISLLSVFDKLLEKVMLNRLLQFLNKNDILYKYQFGFRKNHATSNALTEVIDHKYKSLDEGNYVFGIYIDLKKSIRYSSTPDTPIQTPALRNTWYCIRVVRFLPLKKKTVRSYKWYSV